MTPRVVPGWVGLESNRRTCGIATDPKPAPNLQEGVASTRLRPRTNASLTARVRDDLKPTEGDENGDAHQAGSHTDRPADQWQVCGPEARASVRRGAASERRGARRAGKGG